MTWLALETATDRASVAIGRSAASAHEEYLDGARRHAAAILPMIERLLGRLELSLGELRSVVIADGPGSFTGLRVGATVAKALAATRGLPVFAASSLMGRAHAAAAGREEPVLVTSDALRGDAYAAVYRFGNGQVETIAAPAVISREQLSALAPAGAIVADAVPASARELIALTALPGGAVPIMDLDAWEPVYGRPAEAQAQWERTHGRPLSSAHGLAR